MCSARRDTQRPKQIELRESHGHANPRHETREQNHTAPQDQAPEIPNEDEPDPHTNPYAQSESNHRGSGGCKGCGKVVRGGAWACGGDPGKSRGVLCRPRRAAPRPCSAAPCPAVLQRAEPHQAAPSCATPRHGRSRGASSRTEQHCAMQRHTAPCCATPHHAGQCCAHVEPSRIESHRVEPHCAMPNQAVRRAAPE